MNFISKDIRTNDSVKLKMDADGLNPSLLYFRGIRVIQKLNACFICRYVVGWGSTLLRIESCMDLNTSQVFDQPNLGGEREILSGQFQKRESILIRFCISRQKVLSKAADFHHKKGISTEKMFHKYLPLKKILAFYRQAFFFLSQ